MVDRITSCWDKLPLLATTKAVVPLEFVKVVLVLFM